MSDESWRDFEAKAGEAGKEGIVAEFLGFLAHQKKWWLLPILIVLLLMGGLIYLSTTSAAPFIYTLF